METSTIVGIAVVGAVIVVGYMAVQSMNERAMVAQAQLNSQASQSRSGLESGSPGDILFGIIGGTITGISNAVAADRRQSQGASYGNSNRTYAWNPAMPIQAGNSPVSVGDVRQGF